MSHFNDLADQMGVGADDYSYTPEWDYDADPFAPGPKPLDDGACRECGYLHCDGACALTDQEKNARLRLLTSPFGLDADEVG